MPFTNDRLDHLVSQELSKLSQCNAPEITSSFPQSRHWMSNFVLNSFLGFDVPPEVERLMFFFLRRAEAAFVEYEHARLTLLECVEAPRRTSSLYFRTLHHFEITIAMLYQAFDSIRKFTGTKLFVVGDGSTYERLNRIYNKSRHADPRMLPSGHLHPVWITNDGIHTATCNISFEELRSLLEEVGRFADSISSGKFADTTPSDPNVPKQQS